MQKRIGWSLLLSIIVAASSNAGQKSAIDKLSWMSGCWVSDDGKEKTEECWMKPAGDAMLGIARVVVAGKTVFTEYAQIRQTNGETAYIVSLNLSAKPVAFKLVRSSDVEALFENPTHDFPQRIMYRRESPNALFARIEGKEKGVQKFTEFRYKRLQCE